VSEENIAIVRRCFEGWNRQDTSVVEALSHPDVEIDLSARSLNPDVYRGHSGVERLISEVLEIWEEFAFEPEEFVDAGDRVVVIVRARGRGKGSGATADQRIGQVWTLRDGKVAHFRLYVDPNEALSAVGLPARAD
jgi:ketosteroid isomerase-like protein